MSEKIKISVSEIYDNWAKLVEAVLDREELRQLALCPSFSSSSSAATSPRYSCDSTIFDFSDPSLARRIPLKDLKKATRNFDIELCLGQSPYSFFYKGQILRRSLGDVKGFMGSIPTTVLIRKLDSGVTKLKIEIKSLSRPDLPNVLNLKGYCMEGDNMVLTEIKRLSQLDHPNVFKFKGYCMEGGNMVLVYEYMSKGSLGYYLFKEKLRSLPWNTRIKVAVDIARALSYLHDSSMIQKIHRDLIFLDERFNAKIYCFGFAMDPWSLPFLYDVSWGPDDILSPGMAVLGHLSTKYYVSSFGVILLEIISGRQLSYGILNKNALRELTKAYTGDTLWLAKFIDPKLEGQFPLEQAHIVLTLANHCLDPVLGRPQMCEVLATLEALPKQS